MRFLKIGALEIPVIASLQIDQAYEDMGGDAILRAISGRGIKQETWKKIRITTSGSGWIPAGLGEIDTTVKQLVACVVPRVISAPLATRQAVLPAARRSDIDHLPYGIAILPDHTAVMTPVSISVNTATAVAVAGATAYRIAYFPQVNCWLYRPKESGLSNLQWQFVAEEV